MSRRDSRYTREGRIHSRNKPNTKPDKANPIKSKTTEYRETPHESVETHITEYIDPQEREFDDETKKNLGKWGSLTAHAGIQSMNKIQVDLSDEDGYITTISAWPAMEDGEKVIRVSVRENDLSQEMFDEVIAPLMRDYYEYLDPDIIPIPDMEAIFKKEEARFKKAEEKAAFAKKDDKPKEKKEKKSFMDTVFGEKKEKQK